MKGRITEVRGTVVKATGVSGIQMNEMARVGELGLIGEVVRVEGDNAYIQVYEFTTGLRPGEPVEGLGSPLSVVLGPGIIGNIYDGLQRPLSSIEGYTITRGYTADPVDMNRKWHFVPMAKPGIRVSGGEKLGYIEETELIRHYVLVPPDVSGVLSDVAPEGDYRPTDPIAEVQNGAKRQLTMIQRWPVRVPRPFRRRFPATEPLITGQRIIDSFFPLAKGGSAAVPGGFGTGKTVLLHQIASWANSRVVIYVGCGERGNEMVELLKTFPKLNDPISGKPIMQKSIMIANTSNMPVAAREASIYVGVTLAEYYRDMGYDALMLADSTSRWAEALREISGRLEEIPAEEGYPSYLASRIAAFYERAGYVETLAGDPGSVSIIGAVSPPGGDFTEPVTTHTLRYVKAFWLLDPNLAYSRHYPAVNWISSYSSYADMLLSWWSSKVSQEFPELRRRALDILFKEEGLRNIVRLLGPDVLPEDEKLLLQIAGMLREGFLKQSAYHEVDRYSPPEIQYYLLKLILAFYDRAMEKLRQGKTTDEIISSQLYLDVVRARFNVKSRDDFEDLMKKVMEF
ncbi:MAG: V-type ATP synthase subunit A [Nitrososphaeria archaeon]